LGTGDRSGPGWAAGDATVARGRLSRDHARGITRLNDLRLAMRQVWYINKAFVRNPAALFFTMIFPLMFLVIFTVIFGNGHILVGPNRLVRVATFYVPAIATFSVINAC